MYHLLDDPENISLSFVWWPIHIVENITAAEISSLFWNTSISTFASASLSYYIVIITPILIIFGMSTPWWNNSLSTYYTITRLFNEIQCFSNWYLKWEGFSLKWFINVNERWRIDSKSFSRKNQSYFGD